MATRDEPKIAAVCSSPHVECAHNTLTSKDTGISHKHRLTQTINALERDLSLESAVKEGNTVTLDSNLRDSAPERAFVSSSAAMTMPANALELTTLEHLGVAPGSDMAMAIATAAYLCGYGAVSGENMACAAPDEAVAAFVSNKLACRA